jgi:hypothetical protein
VEGKNPPVNLGEQVRPVSHLAAFRFLAQILIGPIGIEERGSLNSSIRALFF